MRALDAYRDLKRELDKNESPTFTRRDFNYFFNSAIDGYVAKNYAQFPLIQKSLDDIRAIVKYNQTLTFAGSIAEIPADYRHVLNLRASVKFLVNQGRFKKDTIKDIYPERQKSGQEGFNQNNAFHRPSWKIPYFDLAGNSLRLILGSEVSVQGVYLDYIKVPATVFLTPVEDADLSVEVNNTTIEFPVHVCHELVLECKRIVLENIESPRYQSTLQEQAMRP